MRMSDEQVAKRVAALLRVTPTEFGYTFCTHCGGVTRRVYLCDEDGTPRCFHTLSAKKRHEYMQGDAPPRFGTLHEA